MKIKNTLFTILLSLQILPALAQTILPYRIDYLSYYQQRFVNNQEAKKLNPDDYRLPGFDSVVYQNISNEILFEVLDYEGNPILIHKNDLNITVNDAVIIPALQPNKFTLYPTADANSVTLHVNWKGRLSQTFKWKAITQKIPVISLSLHPGDDKIFNLNQVQIPHNTDTLYVVIKADTLFKKLAPKSAYYRVASVKVAQFRGGRLVASQQFPGGVIDLSKFDRRSRDKFQVKILNAHRIGARTCLESTKVNPSSFVFTIK